MKSSLKTIQVLAKIGRILSKIAWIFSIVGAVGCLIGIASLAVGVEEIARIGNMSIRGIVETNAGMSLGALYANMIAGMLVCVGELIVARFAEKYFIHELAAGTPFTAAGADEMKKLGILTICVPLGAYVAANIVYGIMSLCLDNVGELNLENATSVGLGVTFLILSAVFRYGAELKGQLDSGSAAEKMPER